MVLQFKPSLINIHRVTFEIIGSAPFLAAFFSVIFSLVLIIYRQGFHSEDIRLKGKVMWQELHAT